jgi:dihydrofolate reductase
MPKVKVAGFSVSLDGYGAGPHQDLENPLGQRGLELHQWVFKTEFFKRIHGQGIESDALGAATPSAGPRDINNEFAERAAANVGAWILGRNMFGPIRGAWPDDEWKGWWGPNPPYHVPVFVLTHHARPPLEMEGGTTFYFVTDGIESGLKQAKAAAGGKDVRIGGGVATIRQYLKIGAIDEMHLAVAPVFLGKGENLFEGLNLTGLGFGVTSHVATAEVMHVILEKNSGRLK